MEIISDTESENLVISYLNNHNFLGLKIPTNSNKRTPDINIFYHGKKVALCEVKNPKHIPNNGIYLWKTMIRKIRNAIDNAEKQLRTFDPKHESVWIVAFTPNNFQLDWHKFEMCLKGKVSYGTQTIVDLSEKPYVTETNRDLSSVDLFLWFQINQNKEIKGFVNFANLESKYRSKLEKITRLLAPNKSEGIRGK